MIRGAVAVTLMVAAFLLVMGNIATPQQYPNCTEFGFQISTACCCSAGCCKEAAPGEVVHVEGDNYRIVPSGQIVKRTGWSPDGRTIRCACELVEGKWTVFPAAKTNCLFLPMPSS